MQCSQIFPFLEPWHMSMLLNPLFGLMMFWVPEMTMRQLYMIAMRHAIKSRGMPVGAGRCRIWDPRTLRPLVCSYFGLTNKNVHACSYFDCVFLCGGGIFRYLAGYPSPACAKPGRGGTSGISTYKAQGILYIHTMQTRAYARHLKLQH